MEPYSYFIVLLLILIYSMPFLRTLKTLFNPFYSVEKLTQYLEIIIIAYFIMMKIHNSFFE